MAQTRLLVLGFDSMDVELVRRWAAVGCLPAFRRLFESAAWTSYCHPPEFTSAALFASINTGLEPMRHRSQEYLRLRGGSYRLRIGSASDVTGDPFWKAFAQAGRRIVLADVPFMTPAPEYGGRQFWGWGIHDSWTGKKSSVPPGWLRTLSAKFGAYPVAYCQDYTTATNSLMRLRTGLLTAIQRRTAIFKSLILDGAWDLFYGVYSEPHCAGHLMWHLEDETHPKHNAEQVATVGHALRDIYVAIDRAIGELLEMLDGDTASVVFFSQGMGPNYHGGHLFPEVVDRIIGRWTGTPLPSNAANARARTGALDRFWRVSVQRFPVAWRERARLYLPMSLRVWLYMRRVEQPRRWSRMPAFSIPTDGLSVMRVNLIGRDPEGRVWPGEEYARFLDAATAELGQLENAETGEAVVDAMFRTDSRVDPLTIGSNPDLIVWWSKSAPIREIRSPALGVVSGASRDMRTGEHVMRAMILVSHPRARPGYHAIDGLTAMDIPATLCDIAGVPPPCGLDGVSRGPILLAE